MTTRAPPPETPHTMRDAWPWTIAVAAVLLGIAAFALPHAIQAGDAGELATVMLRGGVPHPSGYPWMRILGLPARALEALGLPPVRAAAWPCAVLGIGGWLLFHRVALRVAPPIVATFAVLLVATSATVVLHVNDCEVWGPLLAFAGSFVFIATGPRRPPLLLGLLLGLCVSHHLTGVLLVPLAVAAAWPHGALRITPLLRAGAAGLAGSAVGLLPYATLALGSHGAWRWGDPSTFQGLLHHITRADYGVLSLSLHEAHVPATALLSRVGLAFGRALSGGILQSPAFGWLLLAVVLLGALRRPLGMPARPYYGLWSSAVATIIAFPVAHNIDPRSPFGAWIVERFDILGLALLSPLLARVLAPLLRLVEEPWPRRGLALVGGLLLVRQGLTTRWHGTAADDDGIERYAVDLLQTPAPGRRALVFGTDDHRTFPVLFAQEVLRVRPDVLYVDASLLAHPWYRQRLAARFPGLPDVDKPVALIMAMAADPRFGDTDFYLANLFSRPARSLPLAPRGILWRVALPERGESSVPIDVLPSHRAALARYVGPDHAAMPELPKTPGHPFSADLLGIYPELTAELARGLEATGHRDEAEALLRDALEVGGAALRGDGAPAPSTAP